MPKMKSKSSSATSSSTNGKKRSLFSSAFDRVASLELEDEQANKLRKTKVHQNVAQSRSAKSQTKIYGHLMEARILLQRNLQQQQEQQQHQLEQGTDIPPILDTSSTALVECDKLLEQLLQARRTLMRWHDDKNITLESEYSKCQEHWKQVLNKRHQDLRLHSGLAVSASRQQQQFKVIDSSFWQQVENTVAHEEMRQQQQKQQDQIFDFDDTKVYQQMLKEFVVATNINTDNNTPDNNHTTLQRSKNLASNNKKQVDRKASKGRKIRYVEIPKLVNFCFPVSKNLQHSKSNLSEEEWFGSLFGGAWNNNEGKKKKRQKHKDVVDDNDDMEVEDN